MPRTFEVHITDTAWDDLQAIAAYIAADQPVNAARWLDHLLELIETLSTMPERCPPAPEGPLEGVPTRNLTVGAYRVIFVVLNELVMVLGIRHGARLPSEMIAEGLDQAERELLIDGDEALPARRAHRNRRKKP